MGYTKYVRYGDTLEVYSYEKNVNKDRCNKKKHLSAIQKKRRAEILNSPNYVRPEKSIKRAKKAFFRLCHHNNMLASNITFVTLTYSYDVDYRDSLRHISVFFKRIRENYEAIGHKEISYIGVPELTKKDRYHFHLLVYNLPPHLSTNERNTRNLQRLWQRGYVDISLATYTSKGIAGYMAKYMGKALGNPKLKARRAYNCSRNIEKIYHAGGNSLSGYSDMIVPDTIATETSDFKVPFLGTCTYIRYQL